jgi:hypothetical protein
VRDRNRPEVGGLGPGMKDGVEQQPSSIAIAETEQARRRLPHRRGAVALDIEHAGHRYRMHVGYFPDGAVGEIFLDAIKQNSMLDAFAADAAILISLLLQHGVTPAKKHGGGGQLGETFGVRAAGVKIWTPNCAQF